MLRLVLHRQEHLPSYVVGLVSPGCQWHIVELIPVWWVVRRVVFLSADEMQGVASPLVQGYPDYSQIDRGCFK